MEGSAAAGVAAWERRRIAGLVAGGARERAEAAASPYLPAGEMARLARDRSVEVRRALGSRPDCPGEVLGWLGADRNDSVAEAALGNLACPPAVLAAAMALRPVEVLTNPACPQELLAAGVGDGCGPTVARNPGAGAEVIEALFAQGGRSAYQALAHPACPASVLARAARDERLHNPRLFAHPNLDEATRAWTLAAYRPPTAAYRPLLRNPGHRAEGAVGPSELAGLCANPGLTPGEAHAAVALVSGFERELLLSALATNPSAPPDLLELAYDGRRAGHDRITALVANPATGPATIERMYANGCAWDERLTANPNCPEVVLRAAAERPGSAERKGVASSPNLPSDIAVAMARHELGIPIVEALVRNPATSPAALVVLAGSPFAGVRRSALCHPRCPAEALASVAAAELGWALLYRVVAGQLRTAAQAEAALGLAEQFCGSVAELLATAELLGR